MNIATVNFGSMQHLAGERLQSSAVVDFQVVSFNASPAVLTAPRGKPMSVAVEILGLSGRIGAVIALANRGVPRQWAEGCPRRVFLRSLPFAPNSPFGGPLSLARRVGGRSFGFGAGALQQRQRLGVERQFRCTHEFLQLVE